MEQGLLRSVKMIFSKTCARAYFLRRLIKESKRERERDREQGDSNRDGVTNWYPCVGKTKMLLFVKRSRLEEGSIKCCGFTMA